MLIRPIIGPLPEPEPAVLPAVIDLPALPVKPLLVIELPGEPQPKDRPRFRRGQARPYSTARTERYETALGWAAKRHLVGKSPFDVPVRVVVLAAFAVPPSWSAAKRREALAGRIGHIHRPDWDNLAKVLDGLNRIVWYDDSQIVDARVIKRYAVEPFLRVEVYRATLPQAAPATAQRLANAILSKETHDDAT